MVNLKIKPEEEKQPQVKKSQFKPNTPKMAFYSTPDEPTIDIERLLDWFNDN